mgnify:CR=1 FL=1|jgi:Predicted O-methyltransferase
MQRTCACPSREQKASATRFPLLHKFTTMYQFLNTRRKLLTLAGISGADPDGRTTSKIEMQLKKASATWRRKMKSLVNELGVVELPDRAPVLSERHLQNCRMVANREVILQHMKKGGIVAEVGVQEGHFSRSILKICMPEKLHLVDIELTTYGIHQNFQPEIEKGQVVLHEGDSSTTLSQFNDAYFDFIYIDADHSYWGVQRDIQAAKTRIKHDGFLVFNDYTYWSPGECINYGVIQAVNELCTEEDWELAYFALAGHMYCDVAIRKFQTP